MKLGWQPTPQNASPHPHMPSAEQHSQIDSQALPSTDTPAALAASVNEFAPHAPPEPSAMFSPTISPALNGTRVTRGMAAARRSTYLDWLQLLFSSPARTAARLDRFRRILLHHRRPPPVDTTATAHESRIMPLISRLCFSLQATVTASSGNKLEKLTRASGVSHHLAARMRYGRSSRYSRESPAAVLTAAHLGRLP